MHTYTVNLKQLQNRRIWTLWQILWVVSGTCEEQIIPLEATVGRLAPQRLVALFCIVKDKTLPFWDVINATLREELWTVRSRAVGLVIQGLEQKEKQARLPATAVCPLLCKILHHPQ